MSVGLGPRAAAVGRDLSPPLLAVAVLSVAALLVGAVGLGVGHQQLTGAPAWLKPVKFAISIAVYCATLALLLRLVTGHPRAVRVVSWLAALSLIGELALIDLQVLRGTTSHFNSATPFDAAVFSGMGLLIIGVYGATLGAALLLRRQRGLPADLAAGVRDGVLLALLGMAEGGLMLARAAHTVGAPDGGAGLPVTDWSEQHGDLRVAHFIGLHALQVLPLAALALRRFAPGVPETTAARVLTVLAVGYAGAIVLLTWQAERGQALLHPDAATTVAGLVWATVVTGVGTATLRRSRTASA